MKNLFSLALFLLFATPVACSGSTETASTLQAPTIGQKEAVTPGPAPTAEPLSKALQDPDKADRPKQFTDAADRDLFRLTKELVPESGDIPRTLPGDAAQLEVGHTETFWLVDLANTESYQSEFRLALVTPHAYWYVEEGLYSNQSGLERSASRFEENIYPVVTRVFGTEWSPGIDNDPRLNILNARLNGVAGYFSSTDEYPSGVQPRSNQREIIYLNALNVQPGGANYDHVLAHELQHAIHWNADASEDTWVNEGLAELSASIALDSSFSIRQFLQSSPISLINWPTSLSGGTANYGAASLFMHFFTEHFGGRDNIKTLLAQPEDGIAGINAYLDEVGYDERFKDVFRLWAAANILDDGIEDGAPVLGYTDRDVSAVISQSIRGFGHVRSEIPQYSVEYTELRSVSKPLTLTFRGHTTVPLLPVDVGSSGCWWSNSGDSIDATLSHRIDLPQGSVAMIDYEVWFEIEEDWDYVYVEVSVDGGENWLIIETPATSPENPIGNGFGPGYTGQSRGWLKETVDLSPFAGGDVWIRFQYVTDDAINSSGACFRDLYVDIAGPDPGITADDPGWEAQGFVFVNNVVRQEFQVQLVTIGDNPRVLPVTLDANNAGEITVRPPSDGRRLIVAVAPLAEKTRQPGSYTLSVAPAR